jgi:hypothetical protein
MRGAIAFHHAAFARDCPKLGGDLLQRAVRCGGGNAGDQPD